MTAIETLNAELDELFVQFASGNLSREEYEKQSREVLKDIKFARAKTKTEQLDATYWSKKKGE